MCADMKRDHWIQRINGWILSFPTHSMVGKVIGHL